MYSYVHWLARTILCTLMYHLFTSSTFVFHWVLRHNFLSVYSPDEGNVIVVPNALVSSPSIYVNSPVYLNTCLPLLGPRSLLGNTSQMLFMLCKLEIRNVLANVWPAWRRGRESRASCRQGNVSLVLCWPFYLMLKIKMSIYIGVWSCVNTCYDATAAAKS